MNAKNMPVKYTYFESSGYKTCDAWLEGVQGDGSAIIRIDGMPYRVSAKRLTRLDGSKLIDDQGLRPL